MPPSPTRANDIRPKDPIRHGAYLCLTAAHRTHRISAALGALIDRLALRNEADPGDDHPAHAIGFVRRVAATPPPRDLDRADAALLATEAILHIAAPTPGPVETFCSELSAWLAPAPRILGGVVRPMTYTSNAIHDFAYAHRVLQQPAAAAPHAFFLPMSKTAAWWAKPWMERHTYFLPRYTDAGAMRSEGHVLASAPGVASLMRRTYRHPVEPAPDYDFLTYFECADDGIPVFHAVCAALRDEARNPEWAFVREGPLWQGRRVSHWEALWDS